MPTALIVTRQFGSYKVGDQITDGAVIAQILKSTNHAKVVPVNAPSPVPPAPALGAAD